MRQGHRVTASLPSDAQRVLVSPFLLKALGFFVVAGRAVARPSVLAVVRVTLRAVCLLCVNGGDAARIDQGVIARCLQAKMRRIDAATNAADVVYDHSIRDLATRRVPADSVGTTAASPQVELAIAVRVEAGRPGPASARKDLVLRSESLGFGFGKHESNSIRIAPWDRMADKAQRAIRTVFAATLPNAIPARDADSPDSAPTYTCTTTSEPGGLLG